jgi:hypothetical protein
MAGGGDAKLQRNKFVDMSDEEIQAHFASLRDGRKSRKGLSLKQNISMDEIHEKLLNVLARDVDQLLHASAIKKLEAGDSQTLTNYLKLIKDLKKLEAENLENISDEDLEKIANERSDSEEDPSKA